ncbi:Hypothetical protein PACV_291 [Pacmanvirus A23]|uniref:Hypothetical protein n=1 Tax=Pacmanvirus A23 TaxID=1932881 RepID=UPI000A0953F1|nr:Hypothetical protein B9W72_gp287 [Pacmanvirus A23]SIP86004.1 Hypothetical protein PACV_291 [Pacmanvirus A23]
MSFHTGAILATILAVILVIILIITWYKVHKSASEKFKIWSTEAVSSPERVFTPKTTLPADMVVDALTTVEPKQDFDPEFMNSRECIGASTPTNRCVNSIKFDAENLGVRGDDMFDGDRTVTLGRKASKPSDISTISLLYKDVMNLETDALATPDDCTYIAGSNVYKQPCTFEF